MSDVRRAGLAAARRVLAVAAATACWTFAGAAALAAGDWSAPRIVPSCIADPWGTGTGPGSWAYRVCGDLKRILAVVDNTTVSFVPAMQLDCSIPGDEWTSYPIGSRAVRFTTTAAFARAFTSGPDQLTRFSSNPSAIGGRWWTLRRDVSDPASATGFLPPFLIEQALAVGFLPPYATLAAAVAPGKIAYFGVVGPVSQVDEPGGAVQFFFPDGSAVTPGPPIALGAPPPAPAALSARARHYLGAPAAPAAAAPAATPPPSRIQAHDPACAGYAQLLDVL